ncbi:MAG: translation initiation factor IF-2 N-terminal domain-containing protein, partial [Oscillospiraceae bacterium]
MSTLVKYRVHEVAKDFKMNSKDIAEILTDYATAPKNHMQALEENELDLIFEYLTQHNQVADLAEIFAVPVKPK